MTPTEFYRALKASTSAKDVENAIESFQLNNVAKLTALGRENNRGTIEVASDPVRSAVERLTNSIDAILELEHERHSGLPTCRTPLEAAIAWLGVPVSGLSSLSPQARRMLAQRVTLTLESGDGKEHRVVEVRDQGTGIIPRNMKQTILSLNESNKLEKFYLAGAYGQGGSSTLAFCQFAVIASRAAANEVGFTVAMFHDLPAEKYKIGHYVYLSDERGSVFTADLPLDEFPIGTLVRHIGFDLTRYSSPFGPNSLYGSLNTNLFDPVMPIWLDNRVNDWRRVIKGTRNALNGARDEGDEGKGPDLAHRTPMFSVSLGDFGILGIEYWVLSSPSKSNKNPSASFVNPATPIVLTLNGQNQGEMSRLLLKKNAELPFLTQRLICHLDCNNLSATAKRQLFVSNRESGRDVQIREMLQVELIKALKSDDELTRLNEEARLHGSEEQDENAKTQMRSEVAKLLKIYGVETQKTEEDGHGSRPGSSSPLKRGKRVPPVPKVINIQEPPSYIQIIWEKDDSIPFYPGQRRYIRIETDANSIYHNSTNPSLSRLNLIVGDHLQVKGSTALLAGRMRLVVEADQSAQPTATSLIKVELTRKGLPVLADQREVLLVTKPPEKNTGKTVSLPPFNLVAVHPDDSKWLDLGWPDDLKLIASETQVSNGELTIYYSTVFPNFASIQAKMQAKGEIFSKSFTSRYEIWLAVHSFLLFGDQQADAADQQQNSDDVSQIAEQAERRRVAVLSALVAAKEVRTEENLTLED